MINQLHHKTDENNRYIKNEKVFQNSRSILKFENNMTNQKKEH